jgi:putative membrane protein
MRVFITSWFANAITLYLVARLVPAITIVDLLPPGGGIITQKGLITVLVGSLILGILNACLYPLLKLISLPLTCLTLGLFSFVVTGVVFYLAVSFTPGMSVNGFWWAVLGGVLFGIINSIISGLLGVNRLENERE